MQRSGHVISPAVRQGNGLAYALLCSCDKLRSCQFYKDASKS